MTDFWNSGVEFAPVWAVNDSLERLLGVHPDGHGASHAWRLHAGLERVAQGLILVVILSLCLKQRWKNPFKV